MDKLLHLRGRGSSIASLSESAIRRKLLYLSAVDFSGESGSESDVESDYNFHGFQSDLDDLSDESDEEEELNEENKVKRDDVSPITPREPSPPQPLSPSLHLTPPDLSPQSSPKPSPPIQSRTSRGCRGARRQAGVKAGRQASGSARRQLAATTPAPSPATSQCGVAA